MSKKIQQGKFYIIRPLLLLNNLDLYFQFIYYLLCLNYNLLHNQLCKNRGLKAGGGGNKGLTSSAKGADGEEAPGSAAVGRSEAAAARAGGVINSPTGPEGRAGDDEDTGSGIKTGVLIGGFDGSRIRLMTFSESCKKKKKKKKKHEDGCLNRIIR